MIYYYKDDWDKILTESIVSTLVQTDYLLKQADSNSPSSLNYQSYFFITSRTVAVLGKSLERV